ncbi:MAG: hypothetical protein ACLSAC_05080 [Enterocloster bolteae]
MAKLTNKHAAKLPGNGGYVDAGPDLGAKQPTPYLYDALQMFHIQRYTTVA